MRIAIISSAIGSQCGIAEHSAMLVQHAQAADGELQFSGNPEWLDPQAFTAPPPFDAVHLNYHRGLHSRWTPEVIARYAPVPFIITFHDTYGVQPDRLPWDLLDCPNVRAMIVHEPCDLSGHGQIVEDLSGPEVRDGIYHPYVKKVRYWRQACPDPLGRGRAVKTDAWYEGGWRPTLGTLGFDFPWKNYDMLAEVTGELGWNFHVVGKVEDGRMQELRAKNPRTTFAGYAPKSAAISHLSACDATAFLYTCANSGTSGAIRAGITAGKPIIAAKDCRQFRDLYDADRYRTRPVICWTAPNREALHDALRYGVEERSGPAGYNLGLIGLAHQESWARQGAMYAALYREAARG